MKIAASNILLDDMRFYAYHGVMEQERQVGGEYSLSLTVEADLAEAARTDDVADTINYAALYALVEREMAVPSRLLEHVAASIGWRTLEEYDRVTAVTVKVTKLNPPMGADCKGASVELKLTR